MAVESCFGADFAEKGVEIQVESGTDFFAESSVEASTENCCFEDLPKLSFCDVGQIASAKILSLLE